MPVSFEGSKGLPSPQDMRTLAELFGGGVPQDYREFLETHGGGRPEFNIFRCEPMDINVDDFYDVAKIVHILKLEIAADLPKGVVPVADLECGNLLCISSDGVVWFRDHELEIDVEGGIWRAAPDFGNFWSKLEPYSYDDDDDDDDDLEAEVWTNPDFEMPPMSE